MPLDHDDLLGCLVAEAAEALDAADAHLRGLPDGGTPEDLHRVSAIVDAVQALRDAADSGDRPRVTATAEGLQAILELPVDDQVESLPEVLEPLLEVVRRLSRMAAAAASSPATGVPWDVDDDEQRVDILGRDGRTAFAAVLTGPLNEHRRAGRSIHLLEFDLLHQDRHEDRPPSAVILGLEQHGTIMRSRVLDASIPPLETAEADVLPLLVLYATNILPEMLPSVLLIPEDMCRLVAEGVASTCVDKPPSAGSHAIATVDEDSDGTTNTDEEPAAPREPGEASAAPQDDEPRVPVRVEDACHGDALPADDDVERIGEAVPVDSRPDGSTLRLHLPRPAEIMPALIVADDDRRYAIPQAAIDQLVRVRPREIADLLGSLGGAEVLRHGGDILPLADLTRILADAAAASPITADALRLPLAESGAHLAPSPRIGMRRPVPIVVLHQGAMRFGLVIDALVDCRESVITPLPSHLRTCDIINGAVVLDDGRVALALDLRRVALRGRMPIETAAPSHRETGDGAACTPRVVADAEIEDAADPEVLISVAPEEHAGTPEPVIEDDIDHADGEAEDEPDADVQVVASDEEHAGTAEPVVEPEAEDEPDADVQVAASDEEHAGAAEPVVEPEAEDEPDADVQVAASDEEHAGAAEPVVEPEAEDEPDADVQVAASDEEHAGAAESVVEPEAEDEADAEISEEVLAAGATARAENDAEPPAAGPAGPADPAAAPAAERPLVVLAEFSRFFRRRMIRLLESDGYEVLDCVDGQAAWTYLQHPPRRIQAVLTDIEMPTLDGFRLTRTIRADPRTAHLAVVVMTSLPSESNIRTAKAAGADACHVKLDREGLLGDLPILIERASSRMAPAAEATTPSEAA